MKFRFAFLLLLFVSTCFIACDRNSVFEETEYSNQEKLDKVKQLCLDYGWELRTDISEDSLNAYLLSVDLVEFEHELKTFDRICSLEISYENFPYAFNQTRASSNLVGMFGSKKDGDCGSITAVIIVGENEDKEYYLDKAYVIINKPSEIWENYKNEFFPKTYEFIPGGPDKEDDYHRVHVGVCVTSSFMKKDFHLWGRFLPGAEAGEVYRFN